MAGLIVAIFQIPILQNTVFCKVRLWQAAFFYDKLDHKGQGAKP